MSIDPPAGEGASSARSRASARWIATSTVFVRAPTSWPIALALGECVIGFYAMSKSVMLMPLIMVSIAFIYHRRSLFRITLLAGSFISLFMFLSPIITHVRDMNGKYYDSAVSAKDVPSLYLSYFTSGRESDQFADVETGWMRLSFVNAGHYPPLVLAPGVPPRFVHTPPRLPLGAGGDERVASTIDFTGPDTLLLFTDGLVEHRGEIIVLRRRK